MGIFNMFIVIPMLIDSVSKGGNLLLNVGPTGRGTIDHRAQSALAGMGKWMRYNNRAIYKCTEAPSVFKSPDNSLLTYNPEANRLYIHLLDYPMRYFRLPGYKGKVKYAQFLHDASEIQFTNPPRSIDAGDDLYLQPPVNRPNMEIPVIELILN